MAGPPFHQVNRLWRALGTSHSNARIVYLHFPKCAGTAVHLALASAFPSDQIHHLDPVGSTQAANFLKRAVLAYRRDLLAYHLSRDCFPCLLSGHWGLDEELCREYGDSWDFIALFRDPVDRWFSHYFYDRYKTRSVYRRINEDLEQFVATPRAALEGTLYVRMLTAGGGQASVDIDSACRTLEQFVQLGDQTRIVPFVKAISRRIGRRLRLRPSNVSPVDRESWKSAVEEFRPIVTELCRPDLSVYRFAQERMRS